LSRSKVFFVRRIVIGREVTDNKKKKQTKNNTQSERLKRRFSSSKPQQSGHTPENRDHQDHPTNPTPVVDWENTKINATKKTRGKQKT